MLLLGAGRDFDLTPFDPGQTQIVQGFFPDVQALEGWGYDIVTEPRGAFAQALVVIPRSRALARARLAQASALLPEGAALWIDGLKTDGIDPFCARSAAFCRSKRSIRAPTARSSA
ncbi:hypothetical protein QWZ10_07835 [Paracoccus cavernae]|uniref:PABS domain-containing protein n=1 Tax=Paracoccus cavernae TaxID=1571207 RepID=A0ABT8D4Q4_9RHOB|nr:hypothetical protein [Paracoccus cavernae]